ncbi:hypothetical protein Pmar_PMAR000127 [Perkinsus marinus ATCC 50983]|uniref:Uncharacterized protein n=1 Tax=Perkinsus marinus (strain ATCC 50983 / TXsc) TaxID=423536 RepID=C5KPZ2_PERM5|nr:hypothetical protein Pmar_PMAR000127 [Perkinsus marinus ATCC 50983]EER13539.1 hypothetical protein Pmar_PMAR000127 [Perkinsus marinus ATCC 50983]|eukprot:XP_002781744.1 hypothetical protein Pmar_PMAR000127 [Perkinsus marinus ATCC 50983]
MGTTNYEAKTYFMFQTKADRDAFVMRWRSGMAAAGATTYNIRPGQPVVSFSSRFSAASQMVATRIVGDTGIIDVSDARTFRYAYQLKCLRKVHAEKYDLFPPANALRCNGGGSSCKGLKLQCSRWSNGRPASSYAPVWLMFNSQQERDHMARWWG